MTLEDTLKDILPSQGSQKEIIELLSGMEQNGLTIQEMKGISTDQMEALYGVAYNYYSCSKLEEAVQTFSMLSMLNPYETKYWKGTGACLQLQKKYEEAATAYGMAASTAGIHDPTPHFHAGECYTHLKKLKEACNAFDIACDLSQDKPEFKWVRNKSQAILKTFNTMKESAA